MNTLVQTKEVAIDPMQTIKWESHPVTTGDGSSEELCGTLYVAPCMPHAIDPVQLLAHFAKNKNTYEPLGDGVYGEVHSAGPDLAIKHFTSNSGDLACLRPNVILAKGLEEVEQPADLPVTIRGLGIYAAYVPYFYDWTGSVSDHSLWLMEKIEKVSTRVPYPEVDEQEKLYAKAVERYGVPADSIFYDAKARSNLLLEHLPENPGLKPRTVKIDVMPEDNYFNQY